MAQRTCANYETPKILSTGFRKYFSSSSHPSLSPFPCPRIERSGRVFCDTNISSPKGELCELLRPCVFHQRVRVNPCSSVVSTAWRLISPTGLEPGAYYVLSLDELSLPWRLDSNQAPSVNPSSTHRNTRRTLKLQPQAPKPATRPQSG